MASQVTLKALGLNYSPNNLALPEGSLVVADDVIIRRDNVIESRRGFKEYSQEFGIGTDRSKQLIVYKERILNHYSNVLQYDTRTFNSDGKAIFNNFSGTYSEVQNGLRIKSIEANKNLYFTTSEGIKKIAARSASDFTTSAGFIKNAGGTKSLDFSAELDVSQGQTTGFLLSDSAVAYKTLWGYKDLNDNLILGAPSDSISVYNYLESIIPLDLNAFLLMLDNIAQNNPTVPVATTYASVLHNITTNGSDTFTSSESFSSKFSVDINEDASLYASNLLSAATYLDKFSLLADTNAITNIKPLRVGRFDNVGGVGTITFATTYTFTITSAAFVTGDVYINNGQAFTVVSASATSTTVVMTGYGNPITPSPTSTLTRISGTGSLTLTYSAFTASSNNPSDVFSVGDYLEIQGAVDTANLYTFTVTTAGTTIAVGDVYSNNNQSFIAVTSLTSSTGDIKMIGTGTPTAASTLTRQIGSGTASVSYSGTPSLATSTYSILNNTSIGTNPNRYWQVTTINDTNKTIKFNTPSTFALTYAGFPGSATQILPYNCRYIISTGDSTYSRPLDQLTTSSPATHEELSIIQHNIDRLVSRLQAEKVKVIATALQTAYTNVYSTTSAANVNLTVTIPTTITNNPDYFLQVYRTRNFTCTDSDILGVTVIPDEEFRLVYEAFPTTAEFTAGFISFQDTYPEELRDNNENLYTNPVTGEGASQANDVPPIAKDINRFKNVVFYANTKTRHRLNPFQLLGTSAINAGDSITISDGTVSGTKNYVFTTGVAQKTRLVLRNTLLPSNLVNAGVGRYFTLYSAQDIKAYYIWFRVDNVGTDPGPTTPALSGKIGLRVDLLSTDTYSIIRNKMLYALNSLALDFICTGATTTNPDDTINIENIDVGITTDAADGDIGGSPAFIAITTPTQGAGENASASPPEVLLVKTSGTVTAAQAIDQTARSLVRVINGQLTSTINAYYVSNSSSLPGQINLESKLINDVPFYLQASSVATGSSFNPNLEPIKSESSVRGAQINYISANLVEFRTQNAVGFEQPHGLINGDKIFISLATVAGPVQYFTGIFTVAVQDQYRFRITVTTAGFTSGANNFAWSKLSDVSVSSNETKPNRVYYSKLLQPEAVPLLNYFDIGSEDEAILRIFPLRDSLFVFKQDGLFRISGETAPFVVTLFDTSCVLIAPDTVSVANNIIYGWTTKGISNITEAGVTEISRPVDTAVLKLASVNYTNFTTASWGLGYDSDNSYTVYTCSETDDQVATVAFRFSNLTNTWTNFRRSQTCGLINPVNDSIYTGSGINNIIDQERKNFDRTDYADRDFGISLGNAFLSGNNIQVSNASNIEVGDAFTQEQGLTVYKYNALLDKLDLDTNVGRYGYTVSTLGTTTITINTTQYNTLTPINHNLSTGDWIDVDSSNTVPTINGEYEITVTSPNSFTIQIPEALVSGTVGSANKLTRNYSKTLLAATGDNIRTKLLQLASYLDTDPSLATFSGLYSSIIANKSGVVSSVVAGNPAVINTSGVHQIIDNRVVSISGTGPTPPTIPNIQGTYQVNVTGTFPGNFSSSTSFEIPLSVTTGSAGPTLLNYTTGSNDETVEDILACHNGIVNLLNQNTSGTIFKNYKTITTTTLFEGVVTSVNKQLNIITLNLPLQLISGEARIYKAIPCNVIYSPITFGDPLQLKQVYEATLMFSNRAFTKVKAGFSSDLKPEFTYIEFEGQGNGIFGHYSNPGFGYGFFGGSSNAAPCRTLIPRQNQRCRFINMQFSHKTAREIWSLYGITLTLNQIPSTRAYR